MLRVPLALLLLCVCGVVAVDWACIPTCDETDGRMLGLFGTGMNTLAGTTIDIEFAVDSSDSTLFIELFDGDMEDNHDACAKKVGTTAYPCSDAKVGITPTTTYKLYADPDALGGDVTKTATPIDTWKSTRHPNMKWDRVTVAPKPEAKSASGHYFYLLRITLDQPTISVQQTFKVRTNGALALKTWDFTFVADLDEKYAGDKWNFEKLSGSYQQFGRTMSSALCPGHLKTRHVLYNPSTKSVVSTWDTFAMDKCTASGDGVFDGSWSLFLNVEDPVKYMRVWDGDFDFGASDLTSMDTDDGDTPNSLDDPKNKWIKDSGMGDVLAEGVAAGAGCIDPVTKKYVTINCTGAPADTNWSPWRRRGGDVAYTMAFPDGRKFLNDNPSGNREWEQFLLTNDRKEPADSYFDDDHIPAGEYKISVVGLDAGNVNAWNVEHDVLGVTPTGKPRHYPQPYMISGLVWNDTNKNGVKDAGEAIIPGAWVRLLNADGVEETKPVKTDSKGMYSFEVHKGTWTVAVSHESLKTGALLEHHTAPVTGTSIKVTMSSSYRKAENKNFGFTLSPSPAKIGDLVYEDTNGDGKWSAGEPAIKGVTVRLYKGDKLEDETVTDASGHYEFEETAGTYRVEVVSKNFRVGGPLDGRKATTGGDETSVTLTAGTDKMGVDFGYTKVAAYSIGDTVWEDTDGDGKVDAGETGIGGVKVELLSAGGRVVKTVTTDSSGKYSFTGISGGKYTVRLAASNFVSGGALTFRTYTTATTKAITLTSSSRTSTSIDFGLSKSTSVTIGDTVWDDVDGDGKIDASEKGIDGVTVELWDKLTGTKVGTTTTSGGGKYSFSVTKESTYRVVLASSSFLSGAPLHDFTPTSRKGSGRTFKVTTTTTSKMGIDFGMKKVTSPSVIGDYVFIDTDGDGIKDSGEKGVAGVKVVLYNSKGEVEATNVTDASGHYEFEEHEGDFTVEVDPSAFATGKPLHLYTPTKGGVSRKISVVSGKDMRTVDFGFKYTPSPVVVGGYIYEDADGDMKKGTSESSFGRVKVALLAADGTVVATNWTDSKGYYEFEEEPGTYTVKVVSKNFMEDEILEGRLPTDGLFKKTVTLKTGEKNTTVSFGFGKSVKVLLGDAVFIDTDGDGEYDPENDTGIAGVVVTLKDEDGEVVGTTTTNAAGAYAFEVHPGNYTVTLDDSNFAKGGPMETLTLTVPRSMNHTVSTTMPHALEADFAAKARSPVCRCQAVKKDGDTPCSTPACTLPGYPSSYVITSFVPKLPWNASIEFGSDWVKTGAESISAYSGRWVCTQVLLLE